MNQLKPFLAGFLSTLVFHQGAAHLGYVMGVLPNAAYNLAPTAPWGVPSILSIAFFGGIWGMIIWRIVRRFQGSMVWILSFILGGFMLTSIFVTVVAPLKQIEPSIMSFTIGFVLNGVWGLGNAFFIKLFKGDGQPLAEST